MYSLIVYKISEQISFKIAVRFTKAVNPSQSLQNSAVTCSKSTQSSVIIDIKASP